MTGPVPLLRLAPGDNVAVALRAIATGEVLVVDGLRVTALAPLALGHKIALAAIRPGAEIVKYGMPIGIATAAIAPGDWVHVHNIASRVITNDVDHHEP